MTSRARTGLLLLLAGVALGLISAASVPLRFDHGNSGRYLLPVLQASDPELFAGDPVVSSLQRFRSLFYDALILGVEVLELRPDEIETLFSWLYWTSRALLVLGIMAIARAFDTDPLTAFALGVWACFTSSAPVGGESLFVNVVTHSTAAFLLGAGGLWALLSRRRLAFWLLLSAQLLVHPLMALHLLLCLGPAQLLLRRRIDRVDLIGGAIFGVSLLICSASIPPLSPQEAAVLQGAKGSMNHVALAAQSLPGWLSLLATLAVALGAWHRRRATDPSAKRDLLAAGIVCGIVAACLLSWLATTSEWVRLVQLQPLRTFVWIHLLCYLLIASAAVHHWRRRTAAAPALMALFMLSLVPSLWQPLFAVIALAALYREGWRPLWLAATAGLGLAIVAGWLARDLLPGLETLRTPVVPALVVSVLGAFALATGERLRAPAACAALALACVLSAWSWHRYYDDKDDPAWGATYDDRMHQDWDAARRWFAVNTPRSARVVVAGGRGNFRTLALRSAVGEPMSALVWVDPAVYLEIADEAGRVRECLVSPPDDGDPRAGTWRLPCLVRRAAEGDASYLLVEGDVDGGTTAPIRRFGPYRVYRAGGSSDPGSTGAP